MPRESYRIWRLNPAKRAIAPMMLDARKKDFALTIQRMCKASELGHRHVCDVDGTALFVAADNQAPEGQPGVRFRGTSFTTAGVCVLFGQGRAGLVAAPVDRAWLDRHLEWTSAAEADDDSDDGFGDLVTVVDEEE